MIILNAVNEEPIIVRTPRTIDLQYARHASRLTKYAHRQPIIGEQRSIQICDIVYGHV